MARRDRRTCRTSPTLRPYAAWSAHWRPCGSVLMAAIRRPISARSSVAIDEPPRASARCRDARPGVAQMLASRSRSRGERAWRRPAAPPYAARAAAGWRRRRSHPEHLVALAPATTPWRDGRTRCGRLARCARGRLRQSTSLAAPPSGVGGAAGRPPRPAPRDLDRLRRGWLNARRHGRAVLASYRKW